MNVQPATRTITQIQNLWSHSCTVFKNHQTQQSQRCRMRSPASKLKVCLHFSFLFLPFFQQGNQTLLPFCILRHTHTRIFISIIYQANTHTINNQPGRGEYFDRLLSTLMIPKSNRFPSEPYKRKKITQMNECDPS